jgi:F-type H+-transporting ATPase subunit b
MAAVHGAAAQSPEPASPAQAEPNAASPKSPGYFKQEHAAEKEAETDETTAFRHSPTVQWLANALHIDVETAATVFEYFNFVVTLFLIGILLAKFFPINKILRERRAKLSFELDQAKARTLDAQARLKAVEDKLAGLDAEIGSIRKQVEAEMAADEERSKTLLEEETARIVAAAEQEINAAAAQAQRGLKQFAADLAIDRALSRLTIDDDTDRALFAEFAHDVAAAQDGGRHRGKGGRS